MNTPAQGPPAGRPYKRKLFLIKKSFQLRQVFYALSLPVIFLNLALALVPLLLFLFDTKVIIIPDFEDFLQFYFRVVLSVIILELIGFAIVFWATLRISHRVAGPLFKVSLYLAKMRDGRLDKVWNLRKGDQLVDFYEHFKGAHAGIVQLEKDDITKLKDAIAAAEAAGVDDAALGELRTVLSRKEKSIE